jgi:hypothetical protein
MCGIAGELTADRTPDLAVVERMCEGLAVRGPDGSAGGVVGALRARAPAPERRLRRGTVRPQVPRAGYADVVPPGCLTRGTRGVRCRSRACAC